MPGIVVEAGAALADAVVEARGVGDVRLRGPLRNVALAAVGLGGAAAEGGRVTVEGAAVQGTVLRAPDIEVTAASERHTLPPLPPLGGARGSHILEGALAKKLLLCSYNGCGYRSPRSHRIP